MYSDCHLFYSIYSSRSVYSFLYTIINGNVIASFVPKKKRFETLRCKKIFFVHVRNLEPSPSPFPPYPPSHPHLPCTQLYTFGFIPPLLLCEYVLCGSLPNKPTDGGGGGGGGGLLSFKVLSCGAYWKVVVKRRML